MGHDVYIMLSPPPSETLRSREALRHFFSERAAVTFRRGGFDPLNRLIYESLDLHDHYGDISGKGQVAELSETQVKTAWDFLIAKIGSSVTFYLSEIQKRHISAVKEMARRENGIEEDGVVVPDLVQDGTRIRIEADGLREELMFLGKVGILMRERDLPRVYAMLD